MVTKLTLTLDNIVISNAKQYAKYHQLSLSSIVESYFKRLSSQEKTNRRPIAPITNELSGIAKYTGDKSDKELLAEALSKKYL